MYKFILLLGIYFSLSLWGIPLPDNYSSESILVKDDIVLSVEEVDDTSVVYLENEKGLHAIMVAEWMNGIHGKNEVSISKYLNKGTNYIIFAHFNKIYKGFLFFKGGKWSFSAKLFQDSKKIWSKFLYKKENSLGLKYWKIFKLEVNDNGMVNISSFITNDTVKRLKYKLDKINKEFKINTTNSTPFNF